METWQEVLRKNSIASLETLAERFGRDNFPELDRLRLAADNFEFRISPAMVDLIRSPDDPIWRQYVPSVEELDVVDEALMRSQSHNAAAALVSGVSAA